VCAWRRISWRAARVLAFISLQSARHAMRQASGAPSTLLGPQAIERPSASLPHRNGQSSRVHASINSGCRMLVIRHPHLAALLYCPVRIRQPATSPARLHLFIGSSLPNANRSAHIQPFDLASSSGAQRARGSAARVTL
jgi:hypothetical protein